MTIKERPIIFSAPMVRTILDGSKTQNRRLIQSIGKDEGFVLLDHGSGWYPYRSDDGERSFHTIKKNGKFYDCEAPHPAQKGNRRPALGERNILVGWDNNPENTDVLKWKPSIHMPRHASRILLEATNIRIERLQEISAEDMIVEGCDLEFTEIIIR